MNSRIGKSQRMWVVGGEQRGIPHWTTEWSLYKKAVVAKVNDGHVERVFEYESPPEHRPDKSPSIVFKAATFVGERAYLCTQTEIVVCLLPSFAIERVISLPCFNDVHHVAVAPDGRLFVAVTGLDAVAELSPEGGLIGLTSVLGDSVWDRFSRDVDYRKIPTTKPHRSHPNFVFFLDGCPWVTRFEQRDAVPLYDPASARRFALGHEGVHDGHVWGTSIFFTSVDGHVFEFDLDGATSKVHDLNKFAGREPGAALGWCRGILPSDTTAWIGFSRIRYTKLRRNIDWVRHGFKESELHGAAPTRIACYDLSNQSLVHEVELERVGMNTVFSIHASA